MQEKLIRLVKIIIRDSDNLTLENKIFNGTAFIIFLSTTVGEILNIIIGLHMVVHVATCMGIICSAVIYYLSKNSKYHFKLTILLCVYFIFLFMVLWIFNGGLDGPMPFFFFCPFVCAIIILKNPARNIFLLTVVMVILGLISIDYFAPSLIVNYTDNSQKFLDKTFGLIASLLTVGAMTLFVFSEYVKERESMKKAMEEIKTLKGFIPICANCKEIRDDKGFWNKMEAYIESHSEAEFTHSLCPKCAKILYGIDGLE